MKGNRWDKRYCPCCGEPVNRIENDIYCAIVCNNCRKVLYDKDDKSADAPKAIFKKLRSHMQSFAEKRRDSLHKIQQKEILHEDLQDEEKQLISRWQEYHAIRLELEVITRNHEELQEEDKKKLYCIMGVAKKIETITAALEGRVD